MSEEHSEQVHGERAAPRASALLESLRGVGYSLEAAIADLLDNSISAGARNVWVYFRWSGPKSWALVLDDGNGMTEEDLVEAMRLGTFGPLSARAQVDLGRFGLGLKTASFSQCRCLSVASRIAGKGGYAVRTWDLDFVASVDDWLLRRDISSETAELLRPLEQLEHGTAVVWQCMDRVVGEEPEADRGAEEHFLKAVDAVKRHLAMVFHRFLSGDSAVRVFVNGGEDRHRVRAWDPFVTSHPATFSTPVERLRFKGELILLQGFILPHRDRFNEQDYEAAAGPAGWGAQQGFYVYRNRRLLVAGGWLGLGDGRPWTREEQHKLARISVQFPIGLDAEWQLDVKKSLALPPRDIRDRMAVLARAIRDQSRRVYAQRGRLGVSGEYQGGDVRPWIVGEGSSTPRYRISRSHPLVALSLASPEVAEAVETMLRLVELTVPIQRIWLDSAETMAAVGAGVAPLVPIDDVFPVALQLFRALRDSGGVSAEAARRLVLGEEPFCYYPQLPDLLGSE